MSSTAHLFSGTFDQFAWIRPEGRGNFLISPAVKSYAEKAIAKGATRVVVDLQRCPSIDSTFMGTLASLAKSVRKKPGGAVEIADANKDTARALKDLGLSSLLEINPKEADWRSRLDEVRSSLTEGDGKTTAGVDKNSYVLQAHKELVRSNPDNKAKFSTLIELLEKDQREKS